jgi:hypothetical protein
MQLREDPCGILDRMSKGLEKKPLMRTHAEEPFRRSLHQSVTPEARNPMVRMSRKRSIRSVLS